MKQLKLLRCVLFLSVLFAALSPVTLFSQELSLAQREVWKNVEKYWDLVMQGDLEGYLSYFHSDFSGWQNQEMLPDDKETRRKFETHDYLTTKVLMYDLKPASIRIFSNFAIAHYCFTIVYKDSAGKERTSHGRWTDILMKQGEKWVLVGDHGGKTSD
ncbi:nuclear transport factor 2 family protein [bacterium]|nr:nuclear transport factor 2 family protein [bacterium]